MSKRFLGDLNSNIMIFVSYPDDDDNSDSDIDSDSCSDSDSDDEVLEPLVLDDKNDLQMDKRSINTNSNEDDDNIIEENNIEYLLISTYDSDIPLDINLDVGHDFISYLNQVPNTNAG